MKKLINSRQNHRVIEVVFYSACFEDLRPSRIDKKANQQRLRFSTRRIAARSCPQAWPPRPESKLSPGLDFCFFAEVTFRLTDTPRTVGEERPVACAFAQAHGDASLGRRQAGK